MPIENFNHYRINISLVVLEIEIAKVEALRKKARPHRRQRRRKRPPSRKSSGGGGGASTATWARQRDRRAAEVAWMTSEEELPEDPWELLGHLAGGPGGGGRTGQGGGGGGAGNPGSIWTTSGRGCGTRQGDRKAEAEGLDEEGRQPRAEVQRKEGPLQRSRTPRRRAAAVAQMSESVPGRPADTSDVGKPSTTARQARRRSRSPPGRIRDLDEIADFGPCGSCGVL